MYFKIISKNMNAITKIFISFIAFSVLSGSMIFPQEKKKIPIPGIFSTGLSDDRMPLADGETDPHYILSLSDDASYPGPESKVVFSEGFPMNTWIYNDNESKWIAPRADAGEFNSQGTYVYTLAFSLNAFKHETAEIRGFWTTDNNGLDILLNGKSTGYSTAYNSFAFGFFPFEIKNGFSEGLNTISFVVFNGEAPTGLRVVIHGEAEPKDYAEN
jgi:hypothetical protein